MAKKSSMPQPHHQKCLPTLKEFVLNPLLNTIPSIGMGHRFCLRGNANASLEPSPHQPILNHVNECFRWMILEECPGGNNQYREVWMQGNAVSAQARVHLMYFWAYHDNEWEHWQVVLGGAWSICSHIFYMTFGRCLWLEQWLSHRAVLDSDPEHWPGHHCCQLQQWQQCLSPRTRSELSSA